MKMRSRRAAKPGPKSTLSLLAEEWKVAGMRSVLAQDVYQTLALDERYSLCLLGHVHDEICVLNRLLGLASNPDRTEGAQADADVMQYHLFMRLLLGKLHEFFEVFRSEKCLRDFIAAYFSDDPEGGQRQVQQMQQIFEENPWLRTSRNQSFLHYPKRGQAAKTFADVPDAPGSFEVVDTQDVWNFFYPSADMFANLHWMRIVNSDDWAESLKHGGAAMFALGTLVTESIENSIHSFMKKRATFFEPVQIAVRKREPGLNYFMAHRRVAR
jgi:hypothetical protein